MLRRLLLGFAALLFTVGAFAQSAGTLKGKVIDVATGEPVPFANVSIEENGNVVTGGMTNFDGQFTIKPIPAGKYSVKASYVGYAPLQYDKVQMTTGKITFQDFKLSASAEILAEVEIREYKVPLIKKDATESGGTVTSEDIAKMPGRSADAVATTVGGVYSEDGSVGSIRGARSEATVYYVDGVKVRGSNSVPKSAIEQVSVITGGVPAKYGDVTGGVISVTTKGPTSKYFGGLEVVTSQFLDPYGYNLGGLLLSGPIYSKKEPGTNAKRTVAGFLFSAEGSIVKDTRPSAVGTWVANDDVLEAISNQPLRLVPSENGAVVFNNAEFLQEDAFKNVKTRPNNQRNQINVAGKIDISPVRNLNFTVGGTLDYSKSNVFRSSDRRYTNNLFNTNHHPVSNYSNWRTYARITQKFDNRIEEGEKEPLVKNIFYTIQADYSKLSNNTSDPIHKNNFFDYGYIGKFDTEVGSFYSWGVDSLLGLEGYVQEVYTYSIDSFQASNLNPELANYTNQYFDMFSTNPFITRESIISGSGLMNGIQPDNIYGLFNAPGLPYNSYSEYEATQFRVSASGSADIKDHEISLGFEFEQRNDSYYGLSPYSLWDLAGSYMNSHILQRDLSRPQAIYDANGVFQDTINYPRLLNIESQTTFDKNFRTHLGLDPNSSTDWVDINSYDPSEFDLSMFSADELFNQGKSIVSYYGYDHTGNKVNGSSTVSEFLNTTEDGVYTRPMGAFRPSYIAGYIQDKFSFKDLIFNIGVRVDRYDANQEVLADPYLYSDAYTVGDNYGIIANTDVPSNIPDNAVVYVNDLSNPSAVNGYRVENVWYTANGTQTENPKDVATSNGIAPYLINQTELDLNAFEDYTPQITIMPRVAFSFPISDESLFFAHYDILSKRPSQANRLNPYQYMYIRNINSRIINNPNLTTEKTIDYELGFQQKLGNTSSLKLSAFYREMRDMQQAIAVLGAYPVDYYTYGNIDFGTVKGLTIAYDLRRTGNVSMRASYTLQFANGTGSNFDDAKNIIKSDNPTIRTTLPLQFDQRHNISVTIDYRFGGKANGTPYDGPKLFGANILQNTGLNVIVSAGSGSPYTKRNRPKDGSIVGTINGARKPWRTTVNLKLDRDIRIKLKKADSESVGSRDKYAYLNVYLEVSNLFNTQNILNVYSYTGNADDDGFVGFANNQDFVAQQVDEEAYRNYYMMSISNPYNYSLPRRIKLGVQFNF